MIFQVSVRMVDQLDVRAEKKTPRDIVGIIKWSQLDDKMRLAHDERVENSPKPSMWEYNPKEGMPTELANLDPSTFLTSPLGEILCSLPRDVLARVCSMLSVCDFFYLSLTCRFLHWRMFTFCTCSVPQTVKMHIISDRVVYFHGWKRVPQWIYTLNKGVFNDGKGSNGTRHRINGPGEVTIFRQYLLSYGNEEGLLIQQPISLRKPFFFERVNMNLVLPSYRSKFYDLCLPYILSVRGLVHHLDLNFINQHSPENRFFDFPETNDFLRAVNANYYDNVHRDYITRPSSPSLLRKNKDIYLNCQYARQMYRVGIVNYDTSDVLDVPVFQNTIGIYGDPLDLPIIATLKIFITGSTNLIFHRYVDIEKNNGRFPLIEYLFREFGEFEEFFLYSKREEDDDDNCHIWKKVVRTENGAQLIIAIEKQYEGLGASVTIGKQEMFKEMDTTYSRRSLYRNQNIWWKMETAVEPDEAVKSDDIEEPSVALEPDVAHELNVAVEPDIAVEPIVTVEPVQLVVTVEPNAPAELDVTVVMNESVDQDKFEEEQRVSDVCFCLNNASCSIQ